MALYLLRCKNYYGVSKAACEWSGHFGIKSKGVLYNSIDPDEINQMLKSHITNYREELKIPKNSVVITYTGRMIPEKGVMQLTDAFSKIDIENKALIFAGDGPLYDEIKKLNLPNVFLLGRIDFNHVIALLNSSDIFCLPSRSEGFSTSVLEAVAAHCYVITTKTGGTKELISGDEYGTLMNYNTSEEIYSALNDIMSNPEKREAVCEKAYRKLLENFTWKQTINNIEKIICP